MSNSSQELARFASLLKGAKHLLPPQRPKTAFELAGIHKREVPLTRVLAFFLDPRESHGLKTLVLESLLQATGSTEDPKEWRILRVKLEEPTGSGRIDIVIEADRHVVVIENKIDHSVENDLMDYCDHASKIPKKNTCILLCVKTPGNEKVRGSFCVVTYRNFFRELLARIGDHLLTAEPTHLRHLVEFISTINGTTMDEKNLPEHLKFLRENFSDVMALEKIKSGVIKSLDEKASDLLSKIQNRMGAWEFKAKRTNEEDPDAKEFYAWLEFRSNNRILQISLTEVGWYLETYDVNWVPLRKPVNLGTLHSNLDDVAAMAVNEGTL
jgi:hypothetical protein